jgi:L-ectoine synthase
MIVRRMRDLAGSERDVVADTWRSRRFVLAADGVGFSFHDTVMFAGTSTRMWYRHHVEAVYCIEGHGELEDLETGTCHPIAPGTMYLLDGHERHVLRARTRVRALCVFNPACTGDERHRADGSYAPPIEGPEE